MSLPESKDKRGYSREELKAICKERKIKYADFSNAFGINTCSCAEDGSPRYYLCDVERALYILELEDGRYHAWD
jgi:hypothetical protein